MGLVGCEREEVWVPFSDFHGGQPLPRDHVHAGDGVSELVNALHSQAVSEAVGVCEVSKVSDPMEVPGRPPH